MTQETLENLTNSVEILHEFSSDSVNLLYTGNHNLGLHGYSTVLNTPLVSCSQTAILF